MFYQPPKTHKERLGQELTVTFLNDIILEDASPSEGLQAMLNSGALTHFTMNDEEILLRHLHKVVGDYVEAGEKRRRADERASATGFSELEHLVAEWAIEDGHERYVKRVNSSMDRDPGVLRRGVSPRRGSGRLHRQVRLRRTAARRRREPTQPALLADHRLAGGRAVEATAGKAFGEHHSHES